ncbi:uncharacterized protein LOC143827925 [Paroedura picta]|uniref:uncharacterized protein LOC143827925 n=1 Tax=Paroedura picta TaxID=143630 RepID=UPI004055FE0E
MCCRGIQVELQEVLQDCDRERFMAPLHTPCILQRPLTTLDTPPGHPVAFVSSRVSAVTGDCWRCPTFTTVLQATDTSSPGESGHFGRYQNGMPVELVQEHSLMDRVLSRCGKQLSCNPLWVAPKECNDLCESDPAGLRLPKSAVPKRGKEQNVRNAA